MFCRNCGEAMNPNQAICLKCGVNAGVGNSFCANCGQPVNPNATVCLNCGVALKSAVAGGNGQYLSLTAFEHTGTVGSGQDANVSRQRTDFSNRTTVNTFAFV